MKTCLFLGYNQKETKLIKLIKKKLESKFILTKKT